MSEGYGYVEDDILHLDGFDFSFDGDAGSVKITPISVVWPCLGPDNDNQIVLNVTARSKDFSGSVEVSLPTSCLWTLASELRDFQASELGEVTFPSPSCVVCHEHSIQWTVSKSSFGYQLRCLLADPAVTQAAESISDVNGMAQFELSFQVIVDGQQLFSVAVSQLSALYRCLKGYQEGSNGEGG